MKTKTYNFFKTGKKTASENDLGLSTYNKGVLFDFELIENDLTLTEAEKDLIKADALRYVMASSKTLYYGKQFNKFDSCDGIADFYCHKVYNGKTGKRLYVIMQLTKLNHTRLSRTSVYDNHTPVKIEATSGYYPPTLDIEL